MINNTILLIIYQKYQQICCNNSNITVKNIKNSVCYLYKDVKRGF